MNYDQDVEVYTMDMDKVFIKRVVSRIRVDERDGMEFGRISLGGRKRKVCRHKNRLSWELCDY